MLIFLLLLFIQADWFHEFDAKATKPMTFFGDRYRQNHYVMDFMSTKTNCLANFQDKEVSLLLLPYIDERYSMAIVFPNRKFGLENAEHRLSADKFWNLIDGAIDTEVEVGFH